MNASGIAIREGRIILASALLWPRHVGAHALTYFERSFSLNSPSQSFDVPSNLGHCQFW
jgi:hypothetical protein